MELVVTRIMIVIELQRVTVVARSFSEVAQLQEE
jgi:hypothetical protein